ncbi:PDDEXK nuclease domain-containing protein [Odoribacter sp. OttesenSCG-928-L07]|nr:PDDEXK nuclease domain-containing protein [Odoribacter sp. OttesenSCG-928-L07]MDL2239097.1 PDDEXK nuclease domain-containing protein [Bacteroidales bacterium OttesenSCG-928-L14]MDL2240010.1 PDDEXK nuclease domain-containing protein [Bacteroidales bacterium OttesenSCG-928-K22]
MQLNRKNEFSDIVLLIKQARYNAIKSVNTELIDLYWNVGQYIHERINNSDWGESVVKELADYLSKNEPDLKGFSDKNLWRMKQFYETYKDEPKLSTVLREISWSHNLAIFSRCKTMEEREFYLNIAQKESYSFRELDRQISAGLFERTMIGNTKLSTVLREIYQDEITNTFKDSYVFEFLGLPESHAEKELQKGLILQLKKFILEIGKDFLFISEEYRIQVGNTDFFIDLLFYHRGLQCLVAFELKAEKFKPEHLGQLNFYLEALDRDVKKPNENPSIGILLCKDKDNEVVEYALSRSLSPTMVSEYKMQLPDKKLLQKKIHELFEEQKYL